MVLRLSPEDQAEYDRLCAANVAAKDEATRIGDARAAKKARQANTALYKKFELRQLPPSEPTKIEREEALSLEQRVIRIEHALKLGRFADDFWE